MSGQSILTAEGNSFLGTLATRGILRQTLERTIIRSPSADDLDAAHISRLASRRITRLRLTVVA